MRSAWAVLEKDARLELRSRFALNLTLAFGGGTTILVWFALGREVPTPGVVAALLWLVLLFGASVGLGRAFVYEAEGGTLLLMRLHAPPGALYAGKLAFNLTLVALLSAATTPLFLLVLGQEVANAGLLAGTLALGAVGLAGAATLLAAMLARADQRGAALLPVLLFPLLVPVLLPGVRLTRGALSGAFLWSTAQGDLTTLALFAATVITASALLFEYVWTD
jgi:heme exporter protein B